MGRLRATYVRHSAMNSAILTVRPHDSTPSAHRLAVRKADEYTDRFTVADPSWWTVGAEVEFLTLMSAVRKLSSRWLGALLPLY